MILFLQRARLMPVFSSHRNRILANPRDARLFNVAHRSPGWLLLLVSSLGLALAASFTGRIALAAEPASPPNIVLIISDDQAWTDYSFQQHPAIRTPRLDRLAAESLTFTRGYVPSSLCCPSLMSIITGLYPHQHRITSNDPPLPPGKTGAAANQDESFRAARQRMIANVERVPTLPRLLAERGYLSLQTGKWWQGHYERGGFTHGMTKGDPDQGGRHGDNGLQIGRKTMQPIYDFMDEAQRQQKPFFIWYAPMLPHDPHTPPERLLKKYRALTDSIHVARYWAMVEFFDETCGQLLDALEQRQLTDNTLVVYVTDNGWIQDPQQPKYAPRSKQSPYDGGLRTPIMLRWPGKIKPQPAPELASSIDLAPTILKLVGLPLTPEMTGINLLDPAARSARRTLYGECFTHNAVDIEKPESSLRWRWIIDDNWKLIVPDPVNQPGDQPELFDITTDPLEARNRAADKSTEVTMLRRKLDAWWRGRE